MLSRNPASATRLREASVPASVVPRLEQFLPALSVRSLQLLHEFPREVETQKAVNVKTGPAQCSGEQCVVGHEFGDDMTDVPLARVPYASQHL